MGLFGKGVEVKITEIEDPFPIGDTVMKGTFEITSPKEKTILGYKLDFFMEYETDDDFEQFELGMESSEYIDDDDFQLPYAIQKGETKDVGLFISLDESIQEILEAKGLDYASIKDQLKPVIKLKVDVKGTPLDPGDKIIVNLVEGQS